MSASAIKDNQPTLTTVETADNDGKASHLDGSPTGLAPGVPTVAERQLAEAAAGYGINEKKLMRKVDLRLIPWLRYEEG